THLVTLAANDTRLRKNHLRYLAMEWDARVTKATYGCNLRFHCDELSFTFAFLERPKRNPHWHVLLRLRDMRPVVSEAQAERLAEMAELNWKQLIPSGTVCIKRITTPHDWLTDYIVKELGRQVRFEDFIGPDELWRFTWGLG